METPIIRPYVDQDRGVVLELFNNFQDYLVALDPRGILRRQPGYAESYLEDVLASVNSEGSFMVAEMAGLVVGLVAGIVKQQKPNDLLDHVPTIVGWVTELYVDPNTRKGGVGSMLLSGIEDFFREQGCDTSRLEVFAPNKLARDFYSARGYEERDIELFKAL